MGERGWQVLGMALLIGTLWGGYALWRRGPGRAAPVAERWVALLLAATGAGGFWGAMAWWSNYPGAFSWPLPGLGARMLAAAGGSFALTCLLILWRPFPAHLRLGAAMLWVYLAPLTLAILTLHLTRFDFARPVTAVFFAIVVLLLTGSSLALLRLPAEAAQPPGRGDAAPLAAIAAIAGGWALLLFLWPDGPVPLIWPWPGDALTTRLIASMFLSVATGALLALRDGRRAVTAHAMALAYGIGVIAAGFAHVMTAQPGERGYTQISLPLSYMVVWGTLGLIATLALIRRRRPSGR